MDIGKCVFLRQKILLTEIAALEIASVDAVNRLGGAIGWGLAGDVFFGPVGLLAGLLRGGRGSRINFICQLKDGRKFLASAPSSLFAVVRNSVAIADFQAQTS
jgi:hypothetical protein